METKQCNWRNGPYYCQLTSHKKQPDVLIIPLFRFPMSPWFFSLTHYLCIYTHYIPMMAYSYIETQTLRNDGQNAHRVSLFKWNKVKLVWNWFEKRTMNVEQPLGWFTFWIRRGEICLIFLARKPWNVKWRFDIRTWLLEWTLEARWVSTGHIVLIQTDLFVKSYNKYIIQAKI